MTKPSRMPAARQASYARRKPPVTITCDTDAIDRMIDAIATDIEDAVRPAAQAGAQVLYDEVKRNVAKIGIVSGNLARSIYQAYSKDNSGEGRATYHISWNAAKAQHGHLLEYGHVQRYAAYIGKDGRWHIAVRPEKYKTKPPKRNASQAEKDAYYVTLKGGPRQVAARPFVRPAQAKFGEAQQAAVDELLRRIGAL